MGHQRGQAEIFILVTVLETKALKVTENESGGI